MADVDVQREARRGHHGDQRLALRQRLDLHARLGFDQQGDVFAVVDLGEALVDGFGQHVQRRAATASMASSKGSWVRPKVL